MQDRRNTVRKTKLNKKLTVVINGPGGVGKDTLCHFAERHFSAVNISSITPIKDIALSCGWGGEKNDISRKFLSDLKALTIAFNDYPTKWILEKQNAFLEGDAEILFVHIREPEEIEKFVSRAKGSVITLLVRGGRRFQRRLSGYGNRSDDEVENYRYDYVFYNDKPFEDTEKAFVNFLKNRLMKPGHPHSEEF